MKFPLIQKSTKLAISIIKLVEFLTKNKQNQVLANQILRSGTSVGANIRESNAASSRNDFINKLKIAAKEANETEYWLLLLSETEKLDLKTYKNISSELLEVQKMLSSSISTAKKKPLAN